MKYPKITYWETLPYEKRPIIMYGTGNGADKILDACDKYKIKTDGIFASSGFVRDREFRGMRVMSYEDVVSEFGEDIVILPAFGTNKDDVIENFRMLDRCHDMIIPEVPLYGGGIFDSVYIKNNADRIERVYEKLSDESSRALFLDVIYFRATGKLKYLERCESMSDSLSSLIAPLEVHLAADGGAFRGDSAADMIEAMPTLEKIIACEPDPRTFKKLSEFSLSKAAEGKVTPVECALGAAEDVQSYVSSGSRGAGISGKNRRAREEKINILTLDSIVGEKKLEFLKLDVEGDETEALIGAEKTIRRDRPALAVSLYHRTDDFLVLTERVIDLLGECELYLRRPRCIPMWDLTLYAVPHE